MRKKLVSKTYLKDVSSHTLTFFLDEDKDYYVVVKKIIKCKPFVITSGITLIDNGYKIVEITPKYENYNVRAYLDRDNNVLEYYIDISLENGLDNDAKIPYYTDLYTDITITGDQVDVLDIDELTNALINQDITQQQFELAEATKEKLLDEIATHSNTYLNIDLNKYL